jgi:DNA-binding winged helix-turn-helix (wHTH) protein
MSSDGSCAAVPTPLPSSRRYSTCSLYLMENRDHVVRKDDLFASVWGGRIVSDSTLTSRINAARRAVGDSGENQKLIRTIARKGLRFIGAVPTRDILFERPRGQKG